MIMHEVETDEAPHELWFAIWGMTTKTLQIEFVLIIGLRFGPFSEVVLQSDRLEDRYFGRTTSILLHTIQSVYEEMNLSQIPDLDAVKLSLYYLVKHIFIERGIRYTSDTWLLWIIDDLDEFN